MHQNQNGHNDQNNNKDKDVCLIIITTQGEWQNNFLKTSKVSEVITSVIQHFGFAPNGTYELRLQSNLQEPLKPERTLVSYGLADDECHKVVLTDLGMAA